MSKTLSGYVHVFHDGELVTFAPGDTLPVWAEELVTNPAVFANAESISGEAGPPPAAEKPIAERNLSELKELATALGISKSGKKEALLERIQAHIDAAVPAAASDSDASTGEPPAGETGDDSGEAGLEALTEKALALGITITPEMTEAEIEAIIDQKQD